MDGKGELRIRRVLKSGRRGTPEHVHLDLDERFRVITGIADAELAGRKRRFGCGDVHHVGKGVRHVSLRNNDITDLVY